MICHLELRFDFWALIIPASHNIANLLRYLLHPIFHF